MAFFIDLIDCTIFEVLQHFSWEHLPLGYLFQILETRGAGQAALWAGGVILCVFLAGVILSPVFKGFQRRKLVLFCAVWPAVLSDLSTFIRSGHMAPTLAVHVIIPLAVCAAMTIRCFYRAGAEGTPYRRWRRVTLAGVLGAQIWADVFVGCTTNWHGSAFNMENIWCGIPLLHLGNIFFLSRMDEVLPCFIGDWLCVALVALLLSPLFKRCAYRKAVVLNTVWAMYLFELSLVFWGNGYDVRSLFCLLLPFLASILISFGCLFRIAVNKTDGCRWRLFAVTLIVLLSQFWTLFWTWMAISRGAFGAAC